MSVHPHAVCSLSMLSFILSLHRFHSLSFSKSLLSLLFSPLTDGLLKPLLACCVNNDHIFTFLIFSNERKNTSQLALHFLFWSRERMTRDYLEIHRLLEIACSLSVSISGANCKQQRSEDEPCFDDMRYPRLHRCCCQHCCYRQTATV